MLHSAENMPEFLVLAKEREEEFETTEASALRFLCGDAEQIDDDPVNRKRNMEQEGENSVKETEKAGHTRMISEEAPDPSAESAELRQKYCRTIMDDLMQWSAESDDPLVLEARDRLGIALQALMLAIVRTASPEKRDFIRYYPPARAVLKHNLRILDNAWPVEGARQECPIGVFPEENGESSGLGPSRERSLVNRGVRRIWETSRLS